MGLGLGVLGSAIHSLFDFGWQFPAVYLLFWISAGLLVGQLYSRSNEVQTEEQPLQKKKSVLTVAGAIGALLIGLLLIFRGITLFLGQSYFDRAEPKKLDGNLNEALPLYRLAVRLDPAPDKLRAFGEALFQQGVDKKNERVSYYAESDEIFQRIYRWNPSDYFAYHEHGKIYFMRKDYDLAADQYEKALFYDPIFHPDFQYDLAFLYYERKQPDKAKPVLADILQRYEGVSSTSNPRLPTQLAFLNLLLGRIYREEGRTDLAKQYFQDALRLLPDFALAKDELKNLP